jgi:phospholipid/cholesterol/gamma-HCH transport system substrate-binding protein
MNRHATHRPGTRSRRIGGALLAAAALAAVTSCSAGGIYNLPLPGGANLGPHPLKIDIQFDDVLDLVPQSAVKVDGVPVGRVDTIKVGPDGWTADVTVLVNSSVHLPANATAAVKQTNLLGEKFIELAPPVAEPAEGTLAGGATIPLERTRHATDIEQVLGALSLLLNGGGVADLQPIVTELNQTLGERTGTVRALLGRADTLLNGLNQEVAAIQSALDGLDVLSTRTAAQTQQIGKVLDELPAGIHILDEQRPALIAMLGQLDRLGENGVAVIGKAKDNLISDLLALRPTLEQLGKAAPDLITALPLIPTYPFPDASLPALIGGQMNTWLSVDLQIGTTLSALGVGRGNPVYYPPVGPAVPVNPTNPYQNGNGPRPGWPTVSLLPLLPTAAPIAPNSVDAAITKLSGGRGR